MYPVWMNSQKTHKREVCVWKTPGVAHKGKQFGRAHRDKQFKGHMRSGVSVDVRPRYEDTAVLSCTLCGRKTNKIKV